MFFVQQRDGVSDFSPLRLPSDYSDQLAEERDSVDVPPLEYRFTRKHLLVGHSTEFIRRGGCTAWESLCVWVEVEDEGNKTLIVVLWMEDEVRFWRRGTGKGRFRIAPEQERRRTRQRFLQRKHRRYHMQNAKNPTIHIATILKKCGKKIKFQIRREKKFFVARTFNLSGHRITFARNSRLSRNDPTCFSPNDAGPPSGKKPRRPWP